MTVFKRVKQLSATDYGATAIKKVAVVVFGFASAALIARFLGPAGRGEYALIVNWAAILTVVLNFGISSSYQNARRAAGPEIINIFVAYSLVLFLALLVLSPVLLIFGSKTAFLIGVLSSVMVLRMQLQAYHMIETLQGDARVVVFAHLSNFLMLMVAIIFLPSLFLFAVIVLIGKELIVSLLCLNGLARLETKRASGASFKREFLKQIVASFSRIGTIRAISSWPFLLLTILIMVNYKVDVIFLDAFGIDASLIGIFSIGVIVAEYLWIMSDLFKDVQISRTSKGSTADGVAKAVRMAVAATIVVYLGFIVAGKPLVEMIFGRDFQESYHIAIMMLVANFFIIPCKIIGAYLISMNRTNAYLLSMATAVGVNVALNLLLIPQMGVYGAIIASVISYFLPGITVVWYFMSQTGIRAQKIFVLERNDVRTMMALITKNRHHKS